MDIIYCIIGLLICIEIATVLVYGSFISKEVSEYYMNLAENDLRLNKFDPSILCWNMTGVYITNVPFSLFSKYHIRGVGTIPRWSKLHDRVNYYFFIAQTN